MVPRDQYIITAMQQNSSINHKLHNCEKHWMKDKRYVCTMNTITFSIRAKTMLMSLPNGTMNWVQTTLSHGGTDFMALVPCIYRLNGKSTEHIKHSINSDLFNPD